MNLSELKPFNPNAMLSRYLNLSPPRKMDMQSMVDKLNNSRSTRFVEEEQRLFFRLVGIGRRAVSFQKLGNELHE
jgi:hypothetical protein